MYAFYQQVTKLHKLMPIIKNVFASPLTIGIEQHLHQIASILYCCERPDAGAGHKDNLV